MSDDDIGYKFKHFKNEWIKQTRYHSNPELVYSNENYKEIINLGDKVVPFLIKDLDENDGDWLFALSSILNIDPVNEENRGNWNKMKKDWNKYII